MRCYVVDVKLRVQTETDLSWIRQSLDAACRRLGSIAPDLQILSAVHIRDEDRLSFVLRAADPEDVHRLFEIALLPSARILEAAVVPD